MRAATWKAFLLIVLLCAALCPCTVEALTISDLPGPGETLYVTSDDALAISAGETGVLGGTIVVQGPAGGRPQFDITNEGELLVGSFGSIVSNDAVVNLNNAGAIRGQTLSLDGNYGGTFHWSNTSGSAQLDHLNVDVSGSSGGIASQFDMLELPADVQSISLYNHNAQINIQNNADVWVGALAATNTGWGTINLQNGGHIDAGSITLNTYGAYTNLANSGLITFDTWAMKDQNDSTNLLSGGGIRGGEWRIITNGALGLVNAQLQGWVDVAALVLDANYGGQINLDSIFASTIAADLLAIDASGSSHGQQSSISIYNGADVSVRRLDFDWYSYDYTGSPGIDDYIFYMHGPQGNPVYIRNMGEFHLIPEPASMGLLSTGLIALVYRKRRRG